VEDPQIDAAKETADTDYPRILAIGKNFFFVKCRL
jgi:hypothetical protein